MKKLFILAALIFQLAAAGTPLRAQTAGASPLETKLALENSLEKRLRLVLSEALGTEDIIIIISAEMQEQGKKAAFEIMPGIPEKERMGERSLSSTLTMVKKLSANIILDKSISEEDTKLATKLAAGLLGLPPERQDLINVEKMDFRKARPMSLADLLAPPNIWSITWILVVAGLAAATLFLFLAPLTKIAGAFVESFNAKNTASSQDRQERAADIQDNTPAQSAKETSAAASADGRKPPFWFLDTANTANLAFIMQSRSVEDLTIVLSYAPGDTASKLSEALYPRSVEALAALPAVRLMPEARVRALEVEILSALDYVVGGEDKALTILSGLDEAVQEKALSAFNRIDPLLSRRLNASVIKLADLKDLEPAHAQALARRLPIRVLAAALKNSAYSELFLAKLSAGMQERFRQELELTRAGSPGAYKAERAKVIEALRQMFSEGFIPPKSGNPAAPRPAAAVKPAPAAMTPAPHAVPPASALKPATPAIQAAPPPAGQRAPEKPAISAPKPLAKP